VSLLPPRHIWCNFLIREFGKKGDLKSALIIFRRQQRADISPDMYLYRDIIDACGLCGRLVKAKNIFKVGEKGCTSFASRIACFCAFRSGKYFF